MNQMKRLLLSNLFTIGLVFLISNSILGQNGDINIQINQIDISRNSNPYTYVFLSIEDDLGYPIYGIGKDNLSIQEERLGALKEMDILEILPISESNSKVYFSILMDVSGSMKQKSTKGSSSKILDAKHAIKATWRSALPDSSVMVSTFNNLVKDLGVVTSTNYSTKIDTIKPQGATNLFGAVNLKIQEFSRISGRKVIILLTDGRDTESSLSEKKEVLELLSKSSLSIYTIGLGSNVNIEELKSIPESTPNSDDKFIYAPTSSELSEIYNIIASKVAKEYSVKVVSSFKYYNSTDRILTANVVSSDNIKHYSQKYVYNFGDLITPITFTSVDTSLRNTSGRFNQFLKGFLLLFLILLLFIFLIPFFRKISFRMKYIKLYKKVKNPNVKKEFCYYTFKELKDTDLVVTKCKHKMLLSAWEWNGYKCPDYPQNCKEGIGVSKYQIDFFHQVGINKYLNWLIFGSLAGLISWWAITEILFHVPFKYRVFISFLEDFILPNKQSDDSLIDSTIGGLFLGGIFSLFFALLEEFSIGFRLNSISNILIRVIVGMALGWLILFLTTWMFIEILDFGFAGTLMSWGIFGAGLGGTTTIFSGVRLKSGVLGGFIASMIAYPIFYFFSKENIWLNGELLGFILYGGTLGLLLSVVVSKLENVYLKYVSGKKKIGTKLAIGSFLKSKKLIYVGNDPKQSKVVINDDTIAPRHFALQLNQRQQIVWLIPLSNNGKSPITTINKLHAFDKVKLSDGDILYFGNTVLEYSQKMSM